MRRACTWCGQDANGVNGLAFAEDICVALFVKARLWSEAGSAEEASVASTMVTAARAAVTRAGVNVDWEKVKRRSLDALDPVTSEGRKP